MKYVYYNNEYDYLPFQLFYCNDEVSRMLPHARYSTKHGAARVMLVTVKDAHGAFQHDYPDWKIGLTLFQSLRPRNVRLMGSVPIESCLCTYCTNVRYILSLNIMGFMMSNNLFSSPGYIS